MPLPGETLLDGTREEEEEEEEEEEWDTGKRPLQKKRPTTRSSRPVPAVLEKARRGRSASSSAAGTESPSPPSLSYPCPHCQTCFTGELYLERHVKKSHREQYLQLLRNRTGANLSSLHSKQKRSPNPAVRIEPLSPWEQTNPEPERSLGVPVKDGRGGPAGRLFCTCREAALQQRESQRDTKRQKSSRQGPSEASSVARRFLRMLLEADILLEKAEHPSTLAFLEAWGSVGSPRDCLPDLYADEREGVRVRLRGRALAVCVEELSDVGGGSILNVLAAPVLGEESRLGRAYLLLTRFCAAVSPSAVAQLVVQSLSRYEIGFEDVRVLDTDGSACMRGSYVHVLQGLLTNCVHVTRLGRVVEAVLGAFQKPFRLAARYSELFQRLLAAPGGGRSRYRQCLREVNPTAIAPALPELLHTSWSSGVTAAQHHSERLGQQREFVEREMERSPCSTLRSLQVQFLSQKREDYAVIPGWDGIPNQEFQTYRQILAPEFVANRQRGADGERLEAFWRRASLKVPGLSRLAVSLLNAVVNWTDPPRGLGFEGLVRSQRQRLLSEGDMEKEAFLWFNISKEGRDFAKDSF
ncbi:UNVERIFIED_CONTAM: hypothetical protein FKN15_065199 [Acipenser sinensis]